MARPTIEPIKKQTSSRPIIEPIQRTAQPIQQPIQQPVQQTDPREERIKSLVNNITQVSSTLKNLQQKAQPFLQQDLEAGKELKTAKLPSEQEKPNTTNYLKQKAITDLQNTYTYKQDLVSKLKDTIEGKTGQENLLSTVGAVGKDLVKGIFGFGENIADLGTYGAATLMGLTGRDDLKEALIKNAKADSTGQLFKNADEYYNYTAEKGFKEGEAGSAIAQGIGYVGGVVGLGGLLPSQISQIKLNKIPLVNKIPLLKGLQLPTTSVLSGTGSGMSEALNEGATFEQAGVYGVGKGLLTGISEAIFGSVISGKTGEALKKAYGSNQLDDVFLNYLTKNMGKGGTFATKLAYSGIGEGLEENIEGLLTPYLKRMTYDEKAELYTSQKAFTDFMMGAVVALMIQSPSLTRQVNQQAQKTGQTEQQVIREAVKDIQPPAIADKNIETALNDEIDKAILQKSTRPTIEPVQQPTQQPITSNSQADNGISEDEYVKQQEAQTETQKMFDKIQQDRKGLNIKYDTNIKSNGIFETNPDGTRTITINPNSPKAVEFILVHELSHDLAGTQEYNDLKQTILDYDKTISGFEEARTNVENIYKQVYTNQILAQNPNITPQELQTQLNNMIDEEATNDVLGTMLSDQNYLNQLSTTKPNVFQKIYRWINDMLKRVSGKENKFLQDVKTKFENAYRQQGNSKVGTKYNISEKENKNLIAQHNISEKKLSQLLDLGAIPMPSIAITKYGQPITQFGDITLLFKKDTIDPKNSNNKVYSKDIWSPTFPNVINEIDENLWNEATIKLRNKGFNSMDIEILKEYIQKYGETTPMEVIIKYLEDNNIDTIRENKYNYIGEAKTWINNILGKEVLDTTKKISTKKGNIPYDIINVFREMSKQLMVNSQKGIFGAGFGNINAATAEQLKTIKKIKDKSSELLPAEKADELYKDLSDKIGTTMFKLSDEANYDSIGDISDALVKFAKIKNGTKQDLIDKLDYNYIKTERISEETINNLYKYLIQLKTLPTDYFEAKPKRIVDFNEIDKAIVPYTTSQEIIDKLTDKGVKVVKYTNNEIGRKKAIIEQSKDARFSKQQSGKWEERLQKVYEPLGIKNKKQTVKPLPTKEQLAKPQKTSKDTKKQIINSKTGEAYTLNKPKETKMTGNFYRNIRSLFDEKSAKQITGDFDQAKLDYIKRNNQLAKELFKRTKQYNIKKGSKDSALVQQYGEGIITLEELKQKTKNWKNVVEFDKWFRTNYDSFIDNINDVRKSIYPNVEKSIAEYKEKLQKTYSQIEELSKDTQKNAKRIIRLKLKANSYETILENDELLRNKRVVKRKDYYRHFQEMSQGLGALQNIMSTSSDIPAQMVGVSDFTKPNTKFSTIALRRKGTKTKYDAVGGFLNYIPTANYMISIDPQINVLRSLTKDIQQQMGDDTSANKAIEFLTEFTNKLAGKQNFLDRAVSKVTGRKILKGISWLSGRIKSNLILGNASSSLSQVLNLPQIVGKIKSPKLLLNGFKDSFSKTDYSKSQFITERYESDILSQFDEGILKKPKKFALWMLEALDEKVTKTGWNAFYREAIKKDIKNPEQYADDNIRDMVAGRGIGEKTMLQESEVIGLIAPFTVEVGNMNTVLKGMLKDKKFLDLFITFIVARLLNEGIKQIGGGGSTIDPIKAVWEATTEKDLTMLERFGRVAGEVASNIPMGQVLATLYPEYGTDYLPTRKQLFGDNDPTRFGTGSMFSKAFSSPVTTLVTPWGGAQIEKTIKGLSMFEKAVPGSYNNSGKLRFPVEDTPIKKIQSALFGEYGTSEANEYFDKNRRPLSDTQLNELKYSDNIKREYEKIMKIREENKK